MINNKYFISLLNKYEVLFKFPPTQVPPYFKTALFVSVAKVLYNLPNDLLTTVYHV